MDNEIIIINGRTICPLCGTPVNHKNLEKHMEFKCPECHGQPRPKRPEQLSKVYCPFCESPVNLKNLEKHMKSRCPERHGQRSKSGFQFAKDKEKQTNRPIQKRRPIPYYLTGGE